MVKKAVIVAAGLSSRISSYSGDIPKSLLKIGGTTILERSVKILRETGINDIAIITGFKKEQITSSLDQAITYIFNPFYRFCNNMGSLWFSRNFTGDSPFVYLHADIVYEKEILSLCLKNFSEGKNSIELVTDFRQTDQEAMKVRVTEDNYLLESGKDISLGASAGEWTGIAFIRNTGELFNYIEKIMAEEGLNFYDTYAFTKMAAASYKIFCRSTGNYKWIEIDFPEDYQLARKMFE
jgi:choline kinase